MSGKQQIKRLAARAGYRITRIAPPPVGQDAAYDIKGLLEESPRPVVFDVGANIGQSVKHFREILPNCQIHSFEPGHSAFAELEKSTAGLFDVRINHTGVGATSGSQRFLENDHSYMSSFLPIGHDTPVGEESGGTIVRELEVPVIALDDYCFEHRIESIDILKTDTQGYDLEVLKGADRLLREGRIQLVYTEVIFSHLYENMTSLDELYRFLTDRGMRFVGLYNYAREHRLASWCDALFAMPAPRQTPSTRS